MANKVIGLIDKKNEIFQTRLFREHCFQSESGMYIKDLRIINRSLEHIFLVDNSAFSYGFQPENGVPVLPYMGEKNDTELLTLCEYLLHLFKEQEAVGFNSRHFRIKEYMASSNVDSLVKKLKS